MKIVLVVYMIGLWLVASIIQMDSRRQHSFGESMFMGLIWPLIIIPVIIIAIKRRDAD